MKRWKPLAREFYHPTADAVAAALLGHFLLRRTPEGWSGGPIVETEAYLQEDPACHGAVGLTARNRVMFGPPGHAYVYFIYGCHYCVNAVCQPSGVAEAVLIRAVEPGVGEDHLRRNRAVTAQRDLTSGPAKLCAALGIDRVLDGSDLCDARSELIIAENPAVGPFREDRGGVVITTRIGITRAALLPLRFYLARSPFISRPAQRPATTRNA